MNQFVVVCVNPNRQYRLAIETWDGRNMFEVRTESRPACNENNGLRDPHSFYFAQSDTEASQIAATLTYWNPGSTWSWFKVAGIAESRKPGDKPSIKQISDKGFLPKDIE